MNTIHSDKLVQTIQADYLEEAAAYRQAREVKGENSRSAGKPRMTLPWMGLIISILTISLSLLITI